MAQRLVVLSDMWGSKRGLWITSYLGYLQQYFDIVFYDCQQLANLDVTIFSAENVLNAFRKDGIDTAAVHLLKKETEESHYLTFCTGGSIAWKAALMGLPVKSLYAISAVDLDLEVNRPDCPVNLVFGEKHPKLPSKEWLDSMGLSAEVLDLYGPELYTDEKIIQKVCLDLLEKVLKKQYQL